MKFPKLPCFVTLLLYLQHLSLFAQVTSSPTLISSLGSSSTISVCDPGEIRFTASGDSGPTAIDVEFRIDRGGMIIYPLGFSGQNPVNSILYSNFQDNDIVSARVWTYDGVGGNDFTNSITINLVSTPGASVTLTSNATNNTICSNQAVQFTASSTLPSTQYEFFVNGISRLGPSSQTIFNDVITDSSTVTLIPHEGTCQHSEELFIETVSSGHTIQLTSATETDSQTICNNGGVGSLTPIEYTFGGDATAPPVLSGSLPAGIVTNYDSTNRVFTIKGTSTTLVTSPTIYSYGITSSGPTCGSATLSGTITLMPDHTIALTSGAGTDNQSICYSGNVGTLTLIEYTVGVGATGAPIISGSLPTGVTSNYDAVNRVLTISGTPTTALSTQTTYNYGVTTVGPTSNASLC